jgi:hypothetical protein
LISLFTWLLPCVIWNQNKRNGHQSLNQAEFVYSCFYVKPKYHFHNEPSWKLLGEKKNSKARKILRRRFDLVVDHIRSERRYCVGWWQKKRKHSPTKAKTLFSYYRVVLPLFCQHA